MNQRRRRWGLLAFFVVSMVAFAGGSQSYAQNPDQGFVEEAANQFWYGFDRGDLSSLYKSLSTAFRVQIAEAQFVQTVGYMRIQAGGVALTRALSGSQLMNSPPGFPDGDYFYVRYRARYSNGDVFQDAFFVKDGTAWRVYSFNVLAAPPAQ